MELFKGLPHRTITTENNIFGVSTEEIGRLIGYFLDHVKHNGSEESFDNATAYYVPEEIFLAEDDETVIQYIKQNIDRSVQSSTIYQFYAVKVYQTKNGRMESAVIIDENGLPVLFETNDLSYRNVEKMVESKAMKSIKGYPYKTSLFSLHTSVKKDDNNEWISDGEQYHYKGIGYDGVWALNSL